MLTGHDREPSAQRMGPYEVILDIGSGGMGAISLARATGQPVGVDGFARLVALKRPLGALASDPEVMQRFLDEARLLAQIHHVNVVGVHQIGGDASGHFLVLDYIEGGTLDEMLTRTVLYRKKMPPPIVLRIMSDVLAGLHAVHEAADVEGRPLCMLHRDVSTHNVLVGRDGVARLADFGIAKAIISSTVTDKAYLQGRIPYMAPEYLRRDPVDRRLDVYAAGMTMWTALAGRMPWADAAEAQIVKSIVFDGVPSLASAGVTVAPVVEEIVGRACAREPSMRYATAREMLDAIEDVGRRTGWMGSHAEVAAFVEELLGRELRARRAAIARRLASPERRALDAGALITSPAGVSVSETLAREPPEMAGEDDAGAPLQASARSPITSLTDARAAVTTPTGARPPRAFAPGEAASGPDTWRPGLSGAQAPAGAAASSGAGTTAAPSAPVTALRSPPVADTGAPGMDGAPMTATAQLALSTAIMPHARTARATTFGRVAAPLLLGLLAASTVVIWRWRASDSSAALSLPVAPAAVLASPAASSSVAVAPSASGAPSPSEPPSSSGPSSATSTPAAPSQAPGAPHHPPRIPPRPGAVPSGLPNAITTSNPYR